MDWPRTGLVWRCIRVLEAAGRQQGEMLFAVKRNFSVGLQGDFQDVT